MSPFARRTKPTSGFGSLGRLLAAAALVVSAATVAAAAPAGAGSTAPSAASGSFTDNGNGTVTLTYSGFSPQVFLYASGTTCDNSGFPPNPLYQIDTSFGLTASPMTISTTTNVYSWASPSSPPGTPLPAGTYAFCLYSYQGPISGSALVSDGGSMAIAEAPVSASIVDNGDGTLTLTYANFTATNYFYLLLYADLPSCPATPTGDPGFGFQSNVGAPPSPAVIGVGTPALKIPPTSPVPVPITAGHYAACLYYNTAGSSSMPLQQSLQIGLGIEPAKPSFTG